MKLRRTLSGILFGVGCAMAFVGLLSLILPAVANDQLQLVLASFSMPTQNAAVNCINICMSFALANGWQVLLVGVTLLTIGVALFAHFTREETPQPRDVYRRPVSVPPELLWEQPEPAHTGHNPFAETALWEQYAPKIQPVTVQETPKIGFGSPMLEPNRIEEAELTVPAQAYARTVPPPQPEPEPQLGIVTESEVAEELPQPDATAVEEEPVQAENQPQSGTPVQISPRIRSTVGKRREW